MPSRGAGFRINGARDLSPEVGRGSLRPVQSGPKNLDEFVLLPQPRKIVRGCGCCGADELRTLRDGSLPAQSYRLAIRPDGIEMAAADDAGAHYAAMTLRQLRRVCDGPLPCGTIEDWPDFPVRGIMLDISRCKVPKMETLFRLVDEFSEWKINRLELYTEHTFSYRNHREVWQHADPMTAEQIRELDNFCRARFVELVPNQNCFGHLARWLTHPRYRDLAETPNGHTAWGEFRNYPCSLNPLDPRSIELVAEMLSELLPNFSSRNVNVGCDETVDLGQGRSKSECERIGKGRVYLDFLLKIYELTKRQGRTMHFWGDIILHHPELISELPRDAVALVWGYEAAHPFDKECAAFAKSGLPFFVCPGTSSWNSLVGRTANMLGNIRNAAENGIKFSARGFITTDWGDNGHWQTLPFSYPGFATGAAMSWCVESNRDADFAVQLDAHVFRDTAHVTGAAVLALGDVYRQLSSQRANGSNLFWFLRGDDIAILADKTSASELNGIRDALREISAQLRRSEIRRDDAAQIQSEIALGISMADTGCRRAAGEKETSDDLQKLIAAMRAVWLFRNRAGGCDESMEPLRRRLA